MSDDYLKAAVEIAREAGAILREEFDRPPEISYKGDVDLVTQADKRSEAAIVKRLTQYFPEHAIAAEEGTGHESASHSEFRWHIDPLDGTTNFAHSYPCFCVSIAVAQRDTVIAAVVFNPFYNELFAAARGEGATLNGKKIHVSKVAAFDELALHRLPGAQTPRQPQHSLLLGLHFALPRRAPRWLRRARPCMRGCRALRRLLGVRSAEMGHRRGCVASGGGRREGQRFFRPAVPARRADDFGHQRNNTRRNAQDGARDFTTRSNLSAAPIVSDTC